ncbi:HMG box-containing protein 4-like [Penaeus chinensis]|uniref:HMG box-containing protein 4-like n=1 Tax=Penaeus chinensis TaxID=139456 RepID=UPI001FB80574|nr:HMG box-containing protein 4-like [Penaeus chinensis]XP_047494264.1 HMG box-containing protein 4-like [Penaeus chinensis]
MDVIGVSRSGRVRKKPTTLKDFESPYDVRVKRIAGSPPNFLGRGKKLSYPTNNDDETNGSIEYDMYNVIYEPSKVSYWKDDDNGDEDAIDAQDLHNADKIDPLLLENAITDAPMENSDSNLDSEVQAGSLDTIVDDLIEVKDEPLEIDFLRYYKTDEEDIADEDEDRFEDDPLRLDNEPEFIPVDTSDYSQIESMNLLANTGRNDSMTKDIPVIHKRKLKEPGKTVWTGYRLWAKEARSDILKTSPNMDFADLNRKLGMMWSLLSATRKYNWKRRARRFTEKENSSLPTSLRHSPDTSYVTAGEQNSVFMEMEDVANAENGNPISTAIRRTVPSLNFVDQGFQQHYYC